MNRFLVFLCCLIIAVVSFAQNSEQHLKYMGVPITGTITQFQSKIAAKGVQYDKFASSSIASGTRAFNGTFAGNKVLIFVYYDTQSKVVYREKSVINSVSEDIAEQKYANMRQLFMQKYNDIQYDEQGGKEALTIDTGNGRIDMYVCKDESALRYPYNFSVHIDYWDGDNSDQHDNSLLEDI